MNVGVPPVVLKSARKHTATLIFLHGLGDTGMGWAGALNTIRPDYLKVKIIFSAANRLIGEVLQSWRDALMIIALRTQFHVERPWGQHPFSIVS